MAAPSRLLSRVLRGSAQGSPLRRPLSNVATTLTGTLTNTLSHASARYTEALVETPLLANAISTGVLCAVGDVLAQGLQHRYDQRTENELTGGAKMDEPLSSAFDWGRLLRMTIYGAVVGGPLYSIWHRTLDIFSHAVRFSHEPLLGGWMSAAATRAGKKMITR